MACSLTLVWPRVVVTVDPSNKTQPFSISHVPPLSDPWAVDMTPGRLSMEDILALCVAARSRTMVKEMRESLRGTSWEGQGEGVVDNEGREGEEWEGEGRERE